MIAQRDRWAIVCLHRDEWVAYERAVARIRDRGVDCGPDTAGQLLDTIERLARALAACEAAAQSAHFTGAPLDPETIFDAVGRPEV